MNLQDGMLQRKHTGNSLYQALSTEVGSMCQLDPFRLIQVSLQFECLVQFLNVSVQRFGQTLFSLRLREVTLPNLPNFKYDMTSTRE